MIKRILQNSKRSIGKLILLFLMFLVSNSTKAQFYNGSQMEFGKNRVQYIHRQWFYYRFTNFDIYFYKGGKELAIYASSFAEQEVKRLSQVLDFNSDKKIKFLIFNDLSDLKETNLGLITEEEYNIGGVTHVIDNKVFIYFNGNHKDFENQIRLGLAEIMLQQMMYGGSNSTKVKNSILLSFPKWYTEGLKSYLSTGWNTDIDNIVRHGMTSGRFYDFYKLSVEEQTIAGHSIWQYIAEKYGEKSVSEIVYMAKVNRNIESGFLFILNLDYDMLIEEWKEWYLQKYSRDEDLNYDEEKIPVILKPKKGVVYSNFKVSADGKYLAYCTNEIGKVKLYIKNLETGKKKRILRFGEKLNEKVDYSYPVIAWAPQGNYLTVVKEKKDNTQLMIYNVEEKTWRKRFLMTFDRVLSMAYNNTGNMLVLSVVINGQSDLFLYNLGSNSYVQLTKDIFDDEHPRFINNSTAIIFSSNRWNDSLIFDVETAKNFIRDTLKGQSNHDLFMLPLNSQVLANPQSNSLKRITNTPLFHEDYPLPLGYNSFYFLSNENGITNRYIGKFDSTIAYIDTSTHYRYFTNYFQISQNNYTILEQDINPSLTQLTEINSKNQRYYIYKEDAKPLNQYEKALSEQTNYIRRLILAEEQKQLELKKKIARDTIPERKPEESNKKFRVVYSGEKENHEKIDINNYSFNKDSDSTETKNVQSINNEVFRLYEQRNYMVQYNISEIVNQVDFNYLNYSYQPFTQFKQPIYLNSGFGIFTKIGVMDLMEDYRLMGAVRLVNLFSDNEYILAFSNLKYRLDKEFVFHRNILQDVYEEDNQIVKHFIHDGVINLKYPFNNTKSLRSTTIFTTDHAVNQSVTRTGLLAKDTTKYKLGFRLEFVSDNTRNPSLNILFGTRYKIFAEYYQPIQDYKKNLIVFGFDYRNYAKIYKTFVWANRLAGSTSLGSERLIYYLGGVDNALYQKFNENIQVSKSENYAYQTIATNMRGFDQNIRNGNNFLVLNSELRMPLFQFISKKPVKNSFLNSFMIVGFFDIGTAWTGNNPYSDSNSLYVQIVYQKPITVTIINQNDPLVFGTGLGLRAKILGYYARFDYAWGIQNGYIGKRKLHFSLGMDF